ncbi:MAG: sigma-70 family RNA polymerase sigma factor, partial [Planctomycetota bacterium]
MNEDRAFFQVPLTGSPLRGIYSLVTLPRAALDPETLLAHAPYVRSLVRELVFDAHMASDVEQEVLLAALQHSPRESRALRPWLAVLVRNFARRAWRTGARREQREHGSAQKESSVTTPAEILEREELRRTLVERVLALEEPFRDALILRFFDELPPREIARRLELPVETVRSRIKRGLELLREGFDR